MGFGVYFSASAEELPIMWVDGELDEVLQLAHTHTGEQCVVMVVTAEPRIWRNCEYYTHIMADRLIH